MAWGIRELADLAGVSRRAVRYYNDIGLLAQPERRPNGYKQYDATHLARLLWIKRLTDLGVTVSRIAAMETDAPEQVVQAVDAELAATIETLRRTRTELGRMLRDRTPAELPTGFAPPAAERAMTKADRSFVVVMSRVLGPRQRPAYTDMIATMPPDPAAGQFATLPAHADARTRRDLAGRMAGYVRQIHLRHPALTDLHTDAPLGARFARQALAAAKRELYNPAQRDVMSGVDIVLGRARA
ncbi:MerR family transcriptional regulator [Pseudonocardia nematodicida]|uniref:MerR family transcriptional regulator n=1 Tax=Pseudonocardia nematodicida TaxID=1206997 RepID=A0ABV1KGQ5_9PSEU